MSKKLIILQKSNIDYIFMDFKNDDLTVDLQEFNFMTSIEFSMIARMIKQAKSFKIINANEKIKSDLKVFGLLK